MQNNHSHRPNSIIEFLSIKDTESIFVEVLFKIPDIKGIQTLKCAALLQPVKKIAVSVEHRNYICK